MVFFKKYLIIMTIFLLVGCASKDEIDSSQGVNNFPENDYINAKTLLDNNEFDSALVSFKNIEKNYPLSNWSIKSKIMISFIYYLQLDYQNASSSIERFIDKYPDYKDIDYAYYLKALIAYEQINNPGLDSSNTEKSLKYFEELIRRFPDSEYSKDGKQKIYLINTVLAGKDLHIGMYYLEQEAYLASLNRFKKIIDDYEPNKYTPEALHRIVEIYYTLGMIDNAKKIAAVLGYNYPESEWYERSFEIVGDVNTSKEDSKGWAEKIYKTIF